MRVKRVPALSAAEHKGPAPVNARAFRRAPLLETLRVQS